MNDIESFKNYIKNKIPNINLPKGKKIGRYRLGKGMMVNFRISTESVKIFFYSGTRQPSQSIFSRINKLGLNGKKINEKYVLIPTAGVKNPDLVRMDLEIYFNNRELNSDQMREEVLDVYSKLINLCKPIVNEEKNNNSTQTEDQQVTKINLYHQDSLSDKLDKVTDNDDNLIHYVLKGEVDPFEGFIKYFDKNSEELSEMEYRNGKKYSGRDYYFNADGNPQMMVEFVKGQYKRTVDFDEKGKLAKPEINNKTNFDIKFVSGHIHEAIYKVDGREVIVYYLNDEFNNNYSVHNYPNGLIGVEIDAYAEFFEDPKIDGLKFTIVANLEIDHDGNGWAESFNNFSSVEEPFVKIDKNKKARTLDDLNSLNEPKVNFDKIDDQYIDFPKNWTPKHKVASIIFGAYNISKHPQQLNFFENFIVPSFKEEGVDLFSVWSEVSSELAKEPASYKYRLFGLISEFSKLNEKAKEATFYAVTDLLNISRLKKEPQILINDEYEYLSLCIYYWYDDKTDDKNKYDFRTILVEGVKSNIPNVKKLIELNPETLNLNKWPALEEISLSLSKDD